MKGPAVVLLILCLFLGQAARTETLTFSGGVQIHTSVLPFCTRDSDASVVYFMADMSPESLVMMYDVAGIDLPGRVGVKLSDDEGRGSLWLRPDLIADVVHCVNGTFVACGPALAARQADGLAEVAETDLLDREGSMEIPVRGGRRIRMAEVGSRFADYGGFLVLTHFSGHPETGFSGAVRNISMGFASSGGKARILSGGMGTSGTPGGQEAFLEAMADAAKGVNDHMGDNIVYISLLEGYPADGGSDPAQGGMYGIGILSSLDPLAIDQAAIDLVCAMPGSESLGTRIGSCGGLRTLEAGEAIGLGSRHYQLVVVRKE